MYRWLEYAHWGNKLRESLQYFVDLSAFCMPAVERLFADSVVQMICEDENQFVLGVLETPVWSFLSGMDREQELALTSNKKECLRVSYTLSFSTSDPENPFEKPTNQVDIFWNQTQLVPIPVMNSNKSPKTYKLEFECQFSSNITFVRSQDEFREWNSNSGFVFEELKFVSENQISVEAGEEVVVYMKLLFGREGGEGEETFEIKAMGRTFEVNVLEYLAFGVVDCPNANNVPVNRYVSLNKIVKYHKKEAIKCEEKQAICGHWTKL